MLHLFDLPLEILVKITEFLPNKDILNLSISSKYFLDLVFAVKFTDEVNFESINKLPYFDSFTNVDFFNVTSQIVYPKFLRFLKWNTGQFLRKFPDLLESLEIKLYNQPITQFPDSLKVLNIGYDYNQVISRLPASLEVLKLSYPYNQVLPQLPNSLMVLELSSNYNKQLPSLPDSITCLILSDSETPISRFPNSLKRLEIGWYRSYMLPTIPDSLTELIIGSSSIIRSFRMSRKKLALRKLSQLPKLSPNVVVKFYCSEKSLEIL